MIQIVRAAVAPACLVPACVALLAFDPARADAPDAASMARQYAASAHQNATLMKQYAWKMRVELTVDGETKPAQLYQMRYDMDGRLQKTALTAPEPVKKKRGVRGAIQREKIEDFQEWLGRLTDVLKEYMTPSPGTMMDFYDKASLGPGPDSTARMSAGGFLEKGDHATFWVDPKTNAPVRYEFATSCDGDRVNGTVEFKQLKDGPQYAGRVRVGVPEKKVSVKIENFGYERQ